MNNIRTSFAFGLALSTTLSFGNPLEDKATMSNLPASAPIVETPAPQQVKPVKEQKYSPTQKAAIVDLKLPSLAK